MRSEEMRLPVKDPRNFKVRPQISPESSGEKMFKVSFLMLNPAKKYWLISCNGTFAIKLHILICELHVRGLLRIPYHNFRCGGSSYKIFIRWRLWTNSGYPPVVKLWELTVKCQFFNFKNGENSSHHGCSSIESHRLKIYPTSQHTHRTTVENGLFLWNWLTDTSMCQLVYSPWYVILIVNSIRIDENYAMTYLYVCIYIDKYMYVPYIFAKTSGILDACLF